MDGAFIGAVSLFWTFIGSHASSWLVAREFQQSQSMMTTIQAFVDKER
jgi:hypothetical protein